MISTVYGSPCRGVCIDSEWRQGTTVTYKYTDTWVMTWLRAWCTTGSIGRTSTGACSGCTNVGLHHLKVLGTLLYDLGVRI